MEWSALTERAPRQALLEMIQAFQLTKAINAATTIGVADLLADGPRPCAELAEATGTKAPLLGRLLRMLASVGVFAEVESGVFGLTPAAELLRERPGSLRGFALLYGQPGQLAWSDLVGTLCTGQTGYQLTTGMREWEYYARNPAVAALFNGGMTALSQMQADAVVAAYDFPAAGTVVDVAGGHGTLLATILRARPGLRGVLFDAPSVAAGARSVLEAAGVADRCQTVGGDFFQAVPGGGDVYTLKLIIHDWDDERAAAILRTCRRAMGEGSTLLILDSVVPSGLAGSSAEFVQALRRDVNMMAWTGGLERTAEEFRALLETSGFQLVRVAPTASVLGLVEARPA
jgi:predicted O-methyltransferase YrrM